MSEARAYSLFLLRSVFVGCSCRPCFSSVIGGAFFEMTKKKIKSIRS